MNRFNKNGNPYFELLNKNAFSGLKNLLIVFYDFQSTAIACLSMLILISPFNQMITFRMKPCEVSSMCIDRKCLSS